MSTSDRGLLHVLHVDADPAFGETATEGIEGASDRIQVETATSAGGALDRLDGRAFDCVVAEYDLPDADGVEFLRSIGEVDSAVPVILLTGSEEVAGDAIGAGAADYVPKEAVEADGWSILAGRILEAVETAREDATRRRRLEAIETVQEGISIIDQAGNFSYVNEAYADLYGYEPEEMVGEPFTITYPDGALEVLQADVMPAMEESGFWHGETIGLRSDGTTFVEDHRLAETDDGELVCTVADMTDRRAHERAIEGLHGAVNALMQADSAEDVAEFGVSAVDAVVDRSATAVYYERDDRLEPAAWNDRVEERFRGPPTLDHDNGQAWQVFETGRRSLFDAESSFPQRLDSGGSINAEVPDEFDGGEAVRSGMLLPMGDHGILLVASTEPGAYDEVDVGLVQAVAAHATTALDGIESERALREEREFVDQAISTLNDVFYVVGTDLQFRRWNDRLRDVSGYPEAAIEGMAIGDLFPEEERDRAVERFEETLAEGQATFEAELLTAGGERIPYEFASARLTDTEGEVTGVVGIGRDVSRRKERERQLRRQNERLENFSSIVSHDLRSPLNVADGRLRMPREECESEHLDAVERAHDRMESLIEDLLTVAREGEAARAETVFRLPAVIDQAWSHVDTTEATLVTETDRRIEADRSRLQQLFENLFRNAVEHAGPDVTVTVGDTAEGFYVEDDGPGIPESDRERVTEPGFSTTDGGTGLGLNIVAAHGWELSIGESEAGGARIDVLGVESSPRTGRR